MKKELKKLFMADILEGAKKPTNERWLFIAALLKAITPLTTFTENGYNNHSFDAAMKLNEDDVKKLDKQGFEVFEYFYKHIQSDSVMRNFIWAYKDFVESGNKKYYIFSKPLVGALAQTKTDIGINHLPDSFNGYFELPDLYDDDGELVLGVYASIFTLKGGVKRLALGWMTQETDTGKINTSSAQYLLKPSKTVAESIKSHRTTIIGEDKKVITTSQSIYSSYLSAIINSLVYVSTGQESLELEFNEFKGSKKAVATQKKIYTEKPYIFVGKTFNHKPVVHYTKEEWDTKGHFKWQRHGPENSLLKYIYIDPHGNKRRKK